MATLIGKTLGPYQVVSKLGEGGMGEVYRAHDTRLGRDVAIKVLPADVARDADRRARFEREAHAVAALSHPNILALHDVGVDQDQLYVVTELLEGQTLAERLEDGALSPHKAVEIAVAIARGLSAAHGKGIAHRDLKPANVFLLADGHVKLLDFGLARSTISADRGVTQTQAALTDAGTILGTAGYMAPEQIRGQAVDGRADLFALGVVLYEMVSGQRAFARETTVETLNAILKEDPPELALTRADLPPALDRIVRHCLEKNSSERFQSARDVIFALETLSGSGASARVTAPAPAGARSPLTGARVAWAVAAVAVVGLALSLLLPRRAALSASAATFVAIGAPHQRFFTHAAPEISPDGATIAFWAPDAAGRVQMWVRDLRQPQARALPDTMVSEFDAESVQPAFSPDGRTLLAFLAGKLKRISLDGGSPQTVADAPQPRGATWSTDDQIVYQPAVGGPLFVVAASGGTPRPLNDAKPLDDRRAGPRHPYFLPDGKHFLFSDLVRIYVASVEGGEPRLLVEASSRAEYAAGRLLYVKDGNLMAQPFDASTLQVTGEAQRVVEKVGSGVSSSIDAAFSVSTNGTLAYWEGRTAPLSDLVWLDRAGRRVGTAGKPGHYVSMSATSDLSRVATELIDLQSSWYAADVVDVQRGVSSRISVNQIDRLNTLTPILSRDGSRVWFSAAPGIFRLDVGSELPVLVGVNQGVVWVTDVSPDAKWLLYRGLGTGTAGDIWALPLSGEPTPVPWLQTPVHEVFARFSPDGKWVAFVQRDPEGFAVYLDTFPARGHRQRVSPGTGLWPMWSGDGRHLYYLTPEFQMMEVQIDPTPGGLRVSSPVDLFRAPTPNGTIERAMYWPAPDGQRFLYIARQDEALPRTINVVLDWPALVGGMAQR